MESFPSFHRGNPFRSGLRTAAQMDRPYYVRSPEGAMSGPTCPARDIMETAFRQEVHCVMAATTIQTTTAVFFRVSGSKPAPVHVFVKGGRKWIVASEVCRILGVRTDIATKLVPEQDLSRATLLTKGSIQSVTTITEDGFNLLVAQSSKPVAKALHDWMVREVLPSIPKAPAPKVPVGQGDFF
jgi:hypothetical protein